MTLLLFVVGLVLLVVGAESLVRGSSRLALRIGLPPLVVGLTVVAFGTSTPELAVSVGASLRGDADIALGNVVGSNIFNVLLILGVSAAVAALGVSRDMVRRQVPLMIAASLILLLAALDGTVGRVEGAALALSLVVYTGWLVLGGRAAGAEGSDGAGGPGDGTPPASSPAPLMDALFVVGGLALLVVGARWVVAGARQAALALGVSELVVGLTIVAAGTSLPELATSVVATLRGERDIAVGNVVGSNIFNALGIAGAAALVSPAGLRAAPRVIAVDLPVMVVVALVCLPVLATGRRVSRAEGLLFLAGYVAYTSWLVWEAVG